MRTALEQSNLDSARALKSYRNSLEKRRTYERNKYRALKGISFDAPLSKRGQPKIY